MSKSKEPRWLTMEDGRRAQFDLKRFQKEARKKERELARSTGKKSGMQIMMLREVAKFITPNGDIEAEANRIKNWYYGNNAPSTPEDAYRIADFFGYEDKYTFLMIEDKEASSMNTNETIITKMPLQATPPANEFKAALFALKRREVASELYAYLLDVLAHYYKADVKMWEKTLYCDSMAEGWKEVSPLYPSRYDAIMTIRKKAIFLPQTLLDEATALIESMFLSDLYFDCKDHPQLPNLFDEFFEYRNDQYNEYIKDHEINQEKLTPDDIWIELINAQAEERFERLNEIFEDYL